MGSGLGEHGLTGVPIWLDYICLRQCRDDFQLERVLALMGRVPHVLALVDDEIQYPTRSYCVLEAFAAVLFKATLNVQMTDAFTREALVEHLEVKPVQCG